MEILIETVEFTLKLAAVAIEIGILFEISRFLKKFKR